jgi:hypothetical protein
MPGWIGTNMAANAYPFLGLPPAEQMTDTQVTELFRQGKARCSRQARTSEGYHPRICGISSRG